jgi:xylulokinase
MGFVAIDLGTTNVKAALFERKLNQVNTVSTKIDYIRKGEMVEFDADQYYQIVAKTIRACCAQHINEKEPYQIVLTGQAESLVIIGSDGLPVRNAISWLDERSKQECRELSEKFDSRLYYSITGQVSILPTWPITKILWIKRNEPDIFSGASKYLLLKDYIQYRLTGKLAGEFSIYNFSSYFDTRGKRYWQDILDYCGVRMDQLPELIEPCTDIGELAKQAVQEIGLPEGTRVNVGTLDHFAGMIGTGNIRPGIVSESTGTVLSMATLLEDPEAEIPAGIPCHYGPFKDSYVLLATCESGGISLEWYKNNFLPDSTFEDVEKVISLREKPGSIIFLPNLTGVNPPDYEENASGVFYGLKVRHDPYDLALAVMEGVAYMLASNVDELRSAGFAINRIISTGGGARSQTWSQIKSDVIGCDIAIPANKEAACLGAAIIGAVESGVYTSYQQAIEKHVSIVNNIMPVCPREYQVSYALYKKLNSSMKKEMW